jgi:hypothetical protein
MDEEDRMPTPDEQDRARRYLAATRDRLLAAVDRLTPDQWTFRAAPGRWSIGDTLEHLALVETLVLDRVVPRIGSAPPPPADRDPRAVDARVIASVPRRRSAGPPAHGRASLVEAPPSIRPTGQWRPAESLRRFIEARERAIPLVGRLAPTARLGVVDHLALGPLDGHQWLLFLAAHTDRHLGQIEEIKADPAFPGGGNPSAA